MHGRCLLRCRHVGSTSVEGLSAQPIIDIILVTNNLQQTGKLLTEKLGYRYKGEYNLLLRDLYGKKDKWEIYLHVHLTWNEEIRLNVSFRNYLRSHPDAKKTYEAMKIQYFPLHNGYQLFFRAIWDNRHKHLSHFFLAVPKRAFYLTLLVLSYLASCFKVTFIQFEFA